MSDFHGPLPAGFERVASSTGDAVVIHYRSHGMGCILPFLTTGVVGIGGVLLVLAFTDPKGLMDMFFSDWWAPIAGLSGFIAIACASRFILFHMFGVTIYEMRPDALGISKRLWGAHWNVTLPRDEMLCIEQIKDGGHGDDSFPSWALVVRCRTSHYLLKRQPIEKSDWLGPRVAGFFGIEYRPSRERD